MLADANYSRARSHAAGHFFRLVVRLIVESARNVSTDGSVAMGRKSTISMTRFLTRSISFAAKFQVRKLVLRWLTTSDRHMSSQLGTWIILQLSYSVRFQNCWTTLAPQVKRKLTVALQNYADDTGNT